MTTELLETKVSDVMGRQMTPLIMVAVVTGKLTTVAGRISVLGSNAFYRAVHAMHFVSRCECNVIGRNGTQIVRL
jgi:hypothetical protein